jgi:hypothetical protein
VRYTSILFLFDQMRHALERRPVSDPTAKRTVPPGPTSRAALTIGTSGACACWLTQGRVAKSPLPAPRFCAALASDPPPPFELIEPDQLPAKVKVTWPPQPSLIDPNDFPDVAAAVAQLFARAHIVLAAIKAHGQ